MGWKKVWLLGLALLASRCTFVLGDHPFSNGPKSSGKLDKTPEVLLVRGQDYVVCLPERSETAKLVYFLHLKWMPPQEVWTWGGPVDAGVDRQKLFGNALTVNVNARGKRGFLSYHQINFLVGGQTYSFTTIVMDCNGVSVGRAWSFEDIVSGSVEAAAGL